MVWSIRQMHSLYTRLPHKPTMDLLTQTTWALFPNPNNDCTRVNVSGSSTQRVQPFSPCHCFIPEKTPEKHVREFPSKLSRWRPDKRCQTLLGLSSKSKVSFSLHMVAIHHFPHTSGLEGKRTRKKESKREKKRRKERKTPVWAQ